jgi:S-DNA-T family DNA segregation ATPase FtsK/SpoIIIE
MKQFLIKLSRRKHLIKAFKTAGIYKSYQTDSGERFIYPKIQDIRETKKTIKYVFTLPIGVDPNLLKKHYFVFEQIFGKNIKFDGEIKTFVLSIRKPREEGEKDELPYSVEDIQNSITGLKLPVICGMNQAGEYKTLDLTKEPHILIAGETGSGKSTQLRSILTTWIMSKKPSELELYLGDCKKSEFHIFRKVDHVKCVFSNAKDIKKMLLHVKKELELRSDLTEMFEVGHVDDLPKENKRPYIVVCIDEFVLLRKDETIMEILIDIVCVGRTLGVFAVLSMQRPNAKTLDTTIRSQCTVAMGFSMRDKIESTMVNTPGAEKIVDPGYFIMNADKLYDLQAPYLELDKAKELLNPYYVMKEPTKEAQPKQSEPLKESDVFLDVIDRQG